MPGAVRNNAVSSYAPSNAIAVFFCHDARVWRSSARGCCTTVRKPFVSTCRVEVNWLAAKHNDTPTDLREEESRCVCYKRCAGVRETQTLWVVGRDKGVAGVEAVMFRLAGKCGRLCQEILSSTHASSSPHLMFTRSRTPGSSQGKQVRTGTFRSREVCRSQTPVSFLPVNYTYTQILTARPSANKPRGKKRADGLWSDRMCT